MSDDAASPPASRPGAGRGLPSVASRGEGLPFAGASVAAAVVLALTGATVVFAVRNSWFIGQDFNHLEDMQGRTLGEFLLHPIDIHMPTPLHRLACLIVYRALGMNFVAAMLLLAALQLASAWYLYRILERVAGAVAASLMVCVYAGNFYIVDLFLWWSAGLHRLPYLLASIAACHHGLAYRAGGGRVHLAAIVACYLFALGFYEKAVLIPLYVAGVVLCADVAAPRRPIRAGLLRVLALLCVCSALYAVAFVLVRGTDGIVAEVRWTGILDVLVLQANVLLQILSPIGYLPWLALPAAGVAAAVVVASLRANRRSLTVWLVFGFLLLCNFAFHANPQRISLFEPAYVLAYRYHYENLFLLLLLAGFLLRSHSGVVAGPARREAAGVAPTLLAAGVLAVVFAISLRQVQKSIPEQFGGMGGAAAADFVRNLQQAVCGNGGRAAPVIAHRIAPHILYKPFLFNPGLPVSLIFGHWSCRPRFADEPDATHRLLDDGRLERLGVARARTGY